MPTIRVKEARVDERTFRDKQGRDQIMRTQRAALMLPGGYETAFKVGLGSGPVYPVGDYDLDPDCFALGKYGDLELGRFVKLLPVSKPAAKAA